jgi:hypothetical protein
VSKKNVTRKLIKTQHSRRAKRAKIDGHAGALIPPRSAELLLFVFLPRADRSKAISYLDMQFPKWVKRYGKRLARLVYVVEICVAVIPGIVKLLAATMTLFRLVEMIRYIYS